MRIRKIVFCFLLFCAMGLPCGCIFFPDGNRPDPESFAAQDSFSGFLYPKGIRKACVLTFSEPPTAPGTGLTAARYLYRRLSEARLFPETILVEEPLSAATAEFCRRRRIDLILTGKVTRLFEGSHFMASHVEEEMIAMLAQGAEAPVPILEVSVGGSSSPVRDADWILFRIKGERASGTSALMRKNAEIFVDLLKRRDHSR